MLENELIKSRETCVTEPSMIDEKLIESGALNISWYVSKVYDEKPTGSKSKDFI